MYKILAIDDEQFFLDMVCSYFAETDFQVDTAASYDEGLFLCRQNTYDCILLDIMLPEQDGFSLCREIRKTSMVPIIFLTNKDGEEDRVKGFEMDCDDYVVKPCSFAELACRIRKRIERSSGKREETQLSFGLLKLHTNSKQAVFDGVPILLTAIEFDILVFLATHPGEVFSKYDIYNRVWNQPHLNDIHTVQVHIASLRKKLNQACRNNEYILTVWGKGYQFVGV